MKDNWDYCSSIILRNEGGFVNHPKDPGGATNKGITRATLQAFRGRAVSIEDVKNLTTEEAKAIYKSQYWDPIQGDKLPAGVDLAAFDYAVNSGVGRAAKTIQASIGVAADGHIGAITLQMIENVNVKELIDKICDRRERFVESLSTFSVFGAGWTNRILKVRALSQELARKKNLPALPVAIIEPTPTGNGKAVDKNKKLLSTGLGKASTVAAIGTLGTSLTEAADKLSGLQEVSRIFKIVFVVLLVAGVAATCYSAFVKSSSPDQEP